MRISISLSNYSWPGGPPAMPGHLAEVARAADDAGIDTIWVPDHLLQADPTAGPDDHDMLEAYTVLGFLAARTHRVRLGAMVSPITMRAPALLIKAVTTVHVLSGERAWLGLGAGYHGQEASAMGLDLPPTRERFERLEETIEIASRMWAGDESAYVGTHYQLERPEALPRPRRRPPMLIGGTGPQRTLRLVAQYADACNVFDVPDDGATIRKNLDVLAQHCADVGRTYETIEKTLSTRLAPGETAAQFADRCRAASELGIDHVCLVSARPWATGQIDLLRDAIAHLREA